MKTARPVIDRFMEKVRREDDGCWSWLGTKDPKGYAVLPMKEGDRWRGRRAHRISWELHNGRPIPQGLFVCHKCDNPQCTNPDHLFIGTGSDNMRDCAAKGRVVNLGRSRNTHCVHGHEYTPDTVYLTPQGHRKCLICIRDWQIAHLEQNAERSRRNRAIAREKRLAAAIRSPAKE